MVCLTSYTLLPLRGISPQGETRNSEALSFCRPTELRGWQKNWIHRGAPRPANPVTCFPPGKVVAPATKRGNTRVVREVYAVQSLKSDSLKSRASFGNTIPRAAVSRKPTAESRKPKAESRPVPSLHSPRSVRTYMSFHPPRKKAADFRVRCFDFYH